MATSKTITDMHAEFVGLCYQNAPSHSVRDQVQRYKSCHKLVNDMDQKLAEMKERVRALDATNVEESRLAQIREWIQLLEAPVIEFNQVIEIVETIAGFRNSLPLPKTVKVVSTNGDLLREADDDDLFDIMD